MKRPFPAPRTAAQMLISLSGEEAFEGPLDALLALLDGEPDRILQVPVAELTEQYMEWLESAQERGLAEQVEFVETAVYLIRLKTDALLHYWGHNAKKETTSKGAPDVENPDPREELRLRLKERQEQIQRLRESLQQAARALGRGMLGIASLPRGRDLRPEDRQPSDATNLLRRIREARRLYSQPMPHLEISHEAFTEAELARWLGEQLHCHRGPVDWETLAAKREPGLDRCLLFLALLQGCKGREWTIQQNNTFGRIEICPAT